MSRLARVVGAALLLLSAMIPQAYAAYLIDTGAGFRDYRGPDYVSNYYDSCCGADSGSLGAQFTVSAVTRVVGIEAFMHWRSASNASGTGDPITVKLHKADATMDEYGCCEYVVYTEMPGTVVASGQFHLQASTAPRWHAFDIAADLAPGKYWITLHDFFSDPTDDFFATLPGGAPRPMERYLALLSDSFSGGVMVLDASGSYSYDNPGFGFRVSVVPEPHGALLCALGLAVVAGWRRSRAIHAPTGRLRRHRWSG
jgi:hypothetical protein